MPKSVLDKDLKKVMRLETATHELSRSLAAPGLATLFLVCVFVFTAVLADAGDNQAFVILASVVGAYMALNIGANDVANNMGPAVGGRALKMSTALVIAAVCEMAGAMIAGGEVVETISKGIISPGPGVDVETFMFAMLSALIAAAGWIHLATFMNAPVSTTHSIVGGVLGAGLAAAGPSIVSWSTLSTIAASWVISPLLGGVVAALLLGFIKWAVLFRQDRLAAAQRCVPLLIAMMAGVFGAYLLMKGLNRVWHFDPEVVIALSIGCFVLGWLGARPWVRARLHNLDNRRKHISNLFVLPLIFAAALLSFAHGANDVANAVGPLAAIVAAATSGAVDTGTVQLPIWIMGIGALGIAAGLGLFGPRLIRSVGEKITKMDAIRAYCVALSAAITVLIASLLGLPVSSTHIAVGGIFGVGFLREALSNRLFDTRSANTQIGKLSATPNAALKKEMKREKRKLVRRQHLATIIAAWIITVPAAGMLSAVIFWAIDLAWTN